MFKKIIALGLSLVLIFSISLPGIAGNSKLSGHWAERMIEKGFVEKHFPDFAEDGFTSFSPDSPITQRGFKEALASVLKYYGIDYEIKDVSDEEITRKDAAFLVADEILGNRIVEKKEVLENPFKDIDNLDKKQIDKILLLHDLGILQGKLPDTFSPNDTVTNAQAIIILQRLRDNIENEKPEGIPFKIIDENQSYTSAEVGIKVEEGKDSVILSVVEKLPHPGYSFKVDEIIKEKDVYNIYTHIQEPDPEKYYTQVITFHTIILEISKEDLGEPPYSFRMMGEQIYDDEKLLDDDWKIDPEDVKKIELLSLEGYKVKEFDDDKEIEKLIDSFNNSKVDERAFIEMIAGNTMMIETRDFNIRITSYGSDTNVVATMEKDELYYTKHLICPEIAKLLLEE